MSIDLSTILKKATQLAEQATTEDKAGNHDIAVEAYMAASEWFIHATKYGTMNDSMKQNIRGKANTYLKRAEELKKLPDKTPTPTKATVPSEDSEDPDTVRLMQKFQGAILTNPNVTFDDVVGLEQAKEALKEAVILPVKFPQLFHGKRKPRAGILLYGPPGTGKSYLAKAIATECKSTFISMTSADLFSRWLGECEKGVKCLFELARKRQPCIIFIDEIDALFGQRNDTESESSRRALIEFLIQMEDVRTHNSVVLVFGATNTPWSLDMDIRRRFEKRIYISLPELNERTAMFKTHLGVNTLHTIKEHQWMQLAEKAEHYSGADIALVCQEALLKPVQRLTSATHFKRIPNQNKGESEPTHVWIACSPGDPDSEEMTLDKIHPKELCKPPVTMADMLDALATQKATVDEGDLVKYQEFTQTFGQEGS